MNFSIEETKQILENYWYEVPQDKLWVDVKDEMTKIVQEQLSLPEIEAYKFVCSWFDNRH